MSGELFREPRGLERAPNGFSTGTSEVTTYRCGACLDTGFVMRVPPRYRSIVEPEKFIDNTAGYEFAYSCEDCARGIAIEAGDWAKRTKPDRHGRIDQAMAKAFAERLRAHSRGDELRQRVDVLLGKAEDE